MSTATLPPSIAEPTEERLVLEHITWDQYVKLTDWLIGERPIHATYDRGWLEIMPISLSHELFKGVLGQMVIVLTEEFDYACETLGSMTIRREDLLRGLEPDECYYLPNAERIRGKRELDFKVDPPPDLVIEVDVTSSSKVRIGIYAALGVPEVWRLVSDDRVDCLQLDAAGGYVTSAGSRYFPGLTSEDVSRFVNEALSMDKTAWRKAFRTWVREKLRAGHA